MKDNFLLKKSQQEVFNELSNEEAGKLIKGIFQYANTGKSELEGYLKIIFIPIKTEIDKNEESYKKRCEINKNNGSKGGAPEGNKNAKKEETTENNRTVKKTTENNMNNHNHNHIHISQSNNSLEKIGYGEEKPLIASEGGALLETTKEIISYLNEVTKSKFKYSSKATQSKINARLNEGYTLDDFIVVIDKKTDEWLENNEFSKYLCPETLFGSKFEKYLNQKSNNKPEWLDKKITSKKITIEEQEQLKEMLVGGSK